MRVRTTGIEICHETFGAPGAPPLLLVMGLGTQMIAWPDDFCRDLASRGYRVIRFDNRDTGRSSHLDHLPVPDPLRVMLRREDPPYRIGEMALDTLGLLDALGIERAHVAGVSMGGFIAQEMAVSSPERLRSLSLVMTSTGSVRVGRPRAGLLWRLGRDRRPDIDRDEAVELVLALGRRIGSPAYPPDPGYLRALAERSYDRSHDPAGYLRQVAAVMSQQNRTRKLRSVVVPTVVVHGLADPLVGPSGGRAVAAAVPGARFVGIPGMGHDLPRPLWVRIADEISATAAAGERRMSPVGSG